MGNTTITINNAADFLRALSENPEWKAAVRAQILGEELLQLPAQFQAFVTKQQQFNDQMREFVKKQQQFNESITLRMDRISLQADRITIGMDRLGGDISDVKGGHARSRGIDAAPVIADDLDLEYVRTLSRAEVVEMARTLADVDVATGDRRSFRNADLIMETTHEAETVYVAAEFSFTANRRDSDRAVRNARYLAQQKGCKAHAVVISVRIDRELQELVDAGAINWHQLEDRYLQAE